MRIDPSETGSQRIKRFNGGQLDSSSFTLPDHDIHLWEVFTSAYANRVDELRSSLPDLEMRKAGRFYFKKDKIRFIVAHAMLRRIIASYLTIPPLRISFIADQNGKPHLKPCCASKFLFFNISHSHNLIVFAFSRNRRLGVDVEHVRSMPGMDEIIKGSFHPAEREALKTMEFYERRHAFYDCWTRKEALIKATGEGLRRPLDSFAVSVDRPKNQAASYVNTHQINGESWALFSFRPAPEYSGALAVST